MTDKTDYEILKTIAKDTLVGQTMALAVVVNFLIKKGLFDRKEIVDELNRASNISRSEDLRGLQSGVLSDLAKAVEILRIG